jgi:hypothetical protein
MSKIAFLLALLATALAVTLPAVSAQAQAIRTFVSIAGSDSNPCSITQPCRHFQAAVNATSAGGEVDALDPGAYGSFTISHGITIEGQGWSYVAPPSNGNAITITANAGDNITIHGVSLNGVGTTNSNGIVFNVGSSLTVTDCVIGNMSNYGINFASTTATAASTLTVSNSIVNDNYAAGILVQPRNNATAMFNRVEANNNTYDGIFVSGANGPHSNTVNATAFDSVASGNGSVGFYAYSGGATNAPTTLMVSHSAAANNGFGAEASETGATLHLANSTISGNVNGWTVTGVGIFGVVDSYGDNYIDGNAANQTAPPSIVRK